MPTYDYVCDKCGNTVEVLHSSSEKPEIVCGKDGCTAKMRKSFSSGTAPYIHPNAIPTRKNNSGISPHLRRSKEY